MGGGSREVGQDVVGQESPRGCVSEYTGVRACWTFLSTLKHSGCYHEAPQRLAGWWGALLSGRWEDSPRSCPMPGSGSSAGPPKSINQGTQVLNLGPKM